MADYYPLIARAVDGLGTSTGEARRALYERARSALVAQLRSIEPALSEADITRERLALEDAIRKVEAEAMRKARGEPRAAAPSLRAAPPAAKAKAPAPPESQPRGAAPEETPAAAPQSARARLLSKRPAPAARDERPAPMAREGLRNFREVINEVDDLGNASAKAAQSARDTRDSYAVPSRAEDGETPPLDRVEPQLNPEQTSLFDDTPQSHSLEPSHEPEDQKPAHEPQPARHREAEDRYVEPRPPRSYRGLAKFAVLVIVLVGLAATISWQWSNITGLYQFVSHMRARQTQTTPAPAAEPKFSGRVPQEQNPAQGPSNAPATENQAGPAVAQRVVLYEEDASDPQGKRYVGSVIWRTDTVSPGTGLAPELEVRADITVPEKNMSVTWTLRRNTDQALPASHTIEIMFTLPPDFPGGGVANVPGVLMKESEQARGVPLAGLAVKVTNGFFLIGLSAVDADVQRNIQLLKDRPWFDVPIVYNNGGRAILAMEKGPPGDRAFADAFAAWSK